MTGPAVTLPERSATAPSRALLGRVREWHIIVGGAVLRLAFCLVWAALFPLPFYAPVAGETFFEAGSDGYIQIARTLYLTGEYRFSPGGQPVHNRPPLHPVVMLVFGAWAPQHWYIFWFIATALMSAAFLAVTAALGRRFGLTPTQNKVLLLILALHPYLIFATKSPTFILEATLLLPLVIYLFLRGLDEKGDGTPPIQGSRPLFRPGSRLIALLAGLACGAGALTHGSFLLLPAVLGGLALLWRKPAWSTKVASVGLLIVGTVLPVVPWTVRNYQVFHRFIPVVTGQGILYWLGDCDFHREPGRNLGVIFKQATGREPAIRYSGFVNPDDDALLWDLAKKDIVHRPVHSLQRTALGLYGFWAPWIPSEEGAGPSRGKELGCAVMNLPVVLAVIGLFLWRLWRRQLAFHHVLLAMVLLYINLVFAFFLAVISYFIMVLPLLFLLLVCLLAPVRPAPVGPAPRPEAA